MEDSTKGGTMCTNIHKVSQTKRDNSLIFNSSPVAITFDDRSRNNLEAFNKTRAFNIACCFKQFIMRNTNNNNLVQ